ncbi:MAG TPA: twin-arginine translocase TatA/TatE family subunit [Symbiobacteriaceae bacterium]|jgi:sec-independent protein translocase protein TatA
MFERLGAGEILLILVVALLIFGPSKLPQLGKSLGSGIKEFKSAMKGITEEEPSPAPKQ